MLTLDNHFMKAKKTKTSARVRGSTRERILSLILKQKTLGGGELARKLAVTRQALNLHIRRMLKDRLIWKEGVTRAAVYHPGPGPAKKAAPRKAKPARPVRKPAPKAKAKAKARR